MSSASSQGLVSSATFETGARDLCLQRFFCAAVCFLHLHLTGAMAGEKRNHRRQGTYAVCPCGRWRFHARITTDSCLCGKAWSAGVMAKAEEIRAAGSQKAPAEVTG